MNVNTVSLEMHEAGFKSAETGTVWTRRLLVRILTYCIITEMAVGGLLFLGILLNGVFHFISHTH